MWSLLPDHDFSSMYLYNPSLVEHDILYSREILYPSKKKNKLIMECPICKESLANTPEETDSSSNTKRKVSEKKMNVCCTPCGHLYHEDCLIGWFEQLENQMLDTTCPHCRERVYEDDLYPVYFESLYDATSECEPVLKKPRRDSSRLNRTGMFGFLTSTSSNGHRFTDKDYQNLERDQQALRVENADLLAKLARETERANIAEAKLESLQEVRDEDEEDGEEEDEELDDEEEEDEENDEEEDEEIDDDEDEDEEDDEEGHEEMDGEDEENDEETHEEIDGEDEEDDEEGHDEIDEDEEYDEDEENEGEDEHGDQRDDSEEVNEEYEEDVENEEEH